MTEKRRRESRRTINLYSGNGIDNPCPSEEFWYNLWNNRPRVCLVELLERFREKRKNSTLYQAGRPSAATDFTNSQHFNLRRWKRQQFLKTNTHNGVMACSRHMAHMKRLENLEDKKLNKTRERNKV